MDPLDLAYRHALLRAEIQRRMTTSGRWNGLPGLLDELHSLRQQYFAACAQVALSQVTLEGARAALPATPRSAQRLQRRMSVVPGVSQVRLQIAG